MKDRKWDFIPFSFYDRTGMAAHLENRAAQGWMLERISPFGWFYRRISPAPLHFPFSFLSFFIIPNLFKLFSEIFIHELLAFTSTGCLSAADCNLWFH